MNDDTRIILARRARLIAAALAGAGLGAACASAKSEPQPCLSPRPPTEVIVPSHDAQAPEPVDEDAAAPPPRSGGDAGAVLPPDDPRTRPRICLSEMF